MISKKLTRCITLLILIMTLLTGPSHRSFSQEVKTKPVETDAQKQTDIPIRKGTTVTVLGSFT